MRALAMAAFIVVAVGASVACADDPYKLTRQSMEIRETLPLERASVNGKYRNLLRSIACPMDRDSYRDFHDYGYYTGTEWRGHKNLPAGHWVYVYPKWYIWGEKVK